MDDKISKIEKKIESLDEKISKLTDKRNNLISLKDELIRELSALKILMTLQANKDDIKQLIGDDYFNLLTNNLNQQKKNSDK